MNQEDRERDALNTGPSPALKAQTEKVVRHYLECWQRADIEAVKATYADDFEYHDITSETVVKVDDIEQFLYDTFAFDSGSSTVFNDVFIPSNHTAFVHWTQTLKTPATPSSVCVGGVELIVVRDGKIVSVHEFYDYRPPEPEEAEAQLEAAQAEQLRKLGLDHTDLEDISARATAFLETNDAFLDPDISLQKVASSVGVTRNQLSYVLNNLMQCSFYDWVNSRRVGYVLEKMKRRDIPFSVVTIALEAGFNSISGFYAAFKKQTGVTPSAYRKTLLAQMASDSDRTR